MVSLAMNDASTFVFALNHNSESNKKCAQIVGGSEILLSTGGKKDGRCKGYWKLTLIWEYTRAGQNQGWPKVQMDQCHPNRCNFH